jgi:hypothetical protein
VKRTLIWQNGIEALEIWQFVDQVDRNCGETPQISIKRTIFYFLGFI